MKPKHRATALDRAAALWRQGYRPKIAFYTHVYMCYPAYKPIEDDNDGILIATFGSYHEAVRFTGDIRHAGPRSGRKEHA